METALHSIEELDRIALSRYRAGIPIEEVRQWFKDESRKYRIKHGIELIRESEDEND